MTDVTELTESELKKSGTWCKYQECWGRCDKCNEEVSLLNDCCGEGIRYEGELYQSWILWDLIERELIEYARELAHED